MKRKIFSILALALIFASLLSLCVFGASITDTPPTLNNDSVQEENKEQTDNSLTEEQPKMELKFTPQSLGQTVQILATGMIGVFIVTGIIIMVVLLLNTSLEIIANKKSSKSNDK